MKTNAWILCLAIIACSAAHAADRELASAINACMMAQKVHDEKHAASLERPTFINTIFEFLFPGSPAVNALLATLYISGPPNLLLALVPTNIRPESLSSLVAFGVGGLLGDVFFHLLPETFLGESAEGLAFVLVDTKRNSLLGLAIFLGFASFIMIDKSMRILQGEGRHSHPHDLGFREEPDNADSPKVVKSSKDTSQLRNRKYGTVGSRASEPIKELASELEPKASTIKSSAYLNIVADFTHNITDGLAIASSFWVSREIGAITTVAVFFHEIPHEVGDFALLVQAGFTKYQAMSAQFFTAVGAFLGTFIGIGIQQFSSATPGGKNASSGLLGTSVELGDLVLPFTAGKFIVFSR